MKIARLSICAGAIALLSVGYAWAKPGYVVTTVNLRSGPGTTNEIIGRIPAGSLVDVNNCTNGWCEVAWQGKNGFSIETALDLSGRVPPRGPSYSYGPRYYDGPRYYYGPPTYYYGPPTYYYYGPYWRRRYYWGW